MQKTVGKLTQFRIKIAGVLIAVIAFFEFVCGIAECDTLFGGGVNSFFY
jgi:hypothetical protein